MSVLNNQIQKDENGGRLSQRDRVLIDLDSGVDGKGVKGERPCMD